MAPNAKIHRIHKLNCQKRRRRKKKREGKCSTHLPDLPEGGVDLQCFAQHLCSNVLHVVSAQVHLSQAGVAAQGVDQHGAPRAQAGLGEGQRLQDLEGPTGNTKCKGLRVLGKRWFVVVEEDKGDISKGPYVSISLLTSLVLSCM